MRYHIYIYIFYIFSILYIYIYTRWIWIVPYILEGADPVLNDLYIGIL